MMQPVPRVPLIDRDALGLDETAIYDRVAAHRGKVSNVFRALANSPQVLDRVAAVGEFVRYEMALDDTLREAVILTVAHEHQCAYEWTQHWYAALRLGVDATLLGRIGTPEIESEAAPIGPILRFTRLVARAAQVPGDLADEVQDLLGNAVFVELVVAVGYYSLLARVLLTLQVPLDTGVVAVEMPGPLNG